MPGALADHPAAERAPHAEEVQALGTDHAREHTIERRTLRRQIREWRRLRPAQRKRRLAAERRRSLRIARSSKKKTGTAARVGRWTASPFPIPNFAIHSVVLPTGKVLFWGYPPVPPIGGRANLGLATLWNPKAKTAAQAFKDVSPPLIDADGDGTLEPAPLYCSGQSLMASGAVLAVGGNYKWPYHEGDPYTDYTGINRVFTFNPWTETWTEQAPMNRGRWYPTQVELSDGRTLVMSGYTADPPGGVLNPEAELLTPGPKANSSVSVERVPSADRVLETYPHLFELPTGNVLLAGPGKDESAILDTQSFTWLNLGSLSQSRFQSGAALVPGGPRGSSTVLETGGYEVASGPDPTGLYPAAAANESIDASQGIPGWTPEPPLNVGRANQNLVLLPDGSMVTVGGGNGNSLALGGSSTYSDGRARQVELWDPATRTWRLGPAQLEDRAYHSTASLLPDGRVMSAGDDYHPSVNGAYSKSDTAEIYSPPYLYRKGKRPKIADAPKQITWARKFTIESASEKLKRAVLMAPSATTHGVDMQQRHVELKVTKRLGGAGLKVRSPPSPGVAPPGYYMLFLINRRGEPSVARWVKLRPPGARTKKKRKK